MTIAEIMAVIKAKTKASTPGGGLTLEDKEELYQDLKRIQSK